MISRTRNILSALCFVLGASQVVTATRSSNNDSLLRGLSSNDCPISVEASCQIDDDDSDCADLKREYTACEHQTTEMTLRFNGGDCDQGYNSQPLELFHCVDSSSTPPSMEKASKSYIVVTNVNGLRIVYFSEYVMVGEDFLIVDKEVANRLLDVDLNVTVYSSNELSSDTLLQTFVFHTSCKRSLFLNDFFGSTQMVGFKNDAQGTVSNFKSASLRFVIKNSADNPTELSSFTVATGREVDDIFHHSVTGDEMLQGGGDLTVTRHVYFDVGVSRAFVVLATAGCTGTGDASPCEAHGEVEIIVGTPAEDAVSDAEDEIADAVMATTPSPSAAPVTAMPTLPNDDEHCKLVSSIFCELKDGSSPGCENIQAPTESECRGSGVPSKLTFKYTGQTCAESNHEPDFKHRFVCIDEMAGIENAMKVFVSVNDEEPHQVPKNQEFSWVSSFGSYIHVTVHQDKGGIPGEELQNIKIGTRCKEGDDLTLLKDYGALQLLGFENDSQGVVDSYVDVQMTYMIENKGSANAEELKAVATCADETHELVIGAILGPEQVKKYTSHERVSLLGSPSVRFGLEVTATSSKAACAENNEFFVSVAQP